MKKRFDFTSKLTAIVLCIVLAASPVLSACAAERGKLGDINSDDVVSIGDVTLIQQYIAQMISFDKKEEAAADIDGNGEINILENHMRMKKTKRSTRLNSVWTASEAGTRQSLCALMIPIRSNLAAPLIHTITRSRLWRF